MPTDWAKFRRLFITDEAVTILEEMQAYLEAFIIGHQDDEGNCTLCGADEDEPCDVTCPVGDARMLVARSRYAFPERREVTLED